jgi:hypothetical protein
MNALILSLVVAFSSSFALACQQAGGSITDQVGKYTPKTIQPNTNSAPPAVKKGGRVT